MARELPLVVIADGAEDNIESKVLQGIAQVVACNCKSVEDIPDDYKRQARAILVYHYINWTKEALQSFPRLTIISRYGVGYNNIDVVAATERAIPVCTVPDFGVEEVADSAISHVLNIYRGTYFAARRVANGEQFIDLSNIKASTHGARRCRGQPMSILGMGRIGSAIAVRAQVFGFDVAFYDPWVPLGIEKVFKCRRFESIDDALPHTDCLVIMAPMSNNNKHMIDARRLALLKKGACIVNVSRGGLIDEEALATAIRNGHIRAAALDVHENEPNNIFDCSMRDLQEHVIATPHSAFYSAESECELREKAAANVRRALLNIQNARHVTQGLVSCINAYQL